MSYHRDTWFKIEFLNPETIEWEELTSTCRNSSEAEKEIFYRMSLGCPYTKNRKDYRIIMVDETVL